MTLLEALVGLHGLWQVEQVAGALMRTTALLTVVALVTRFVGGYAGSRARVWTIAMFALLAVPLLALPVSVLTLEVKAAGWMVSLDNPVDLSRGVRGALARLMGAPVGPAVTTVAPGEVMRSAATAVAATWVTLAWAIGTLTVLIRMIVGWARVRAVVRSAIPPTRGSPVVSTSRAVAAEIELARRVQVALSQRISIPMTVGLIRPVVLLPTAASEWDVVRLRTVLLHELMHVRRRDWLAQVVARVACALNWFNPAVWYAARRHRTELEFACDRDVVTRGVDPIAYASELVELARLGAVRGPMHSSVSLAFVRRSDLEGRVRALLEPVEPRHAPGGDVVARSAIVVALIVLSTIRPVLGRCDQPLVVARAAISAAGLVAPLPPRPIPD